MKKTDTFIKITGLKIFANHGVFQEEKEQGQDFYINAKIYYDMRDAGRTDDLKNAVSYAEICAYMVKVFKEQTFDLIEAAAMHLCQQLLLEFAEVTYIELELCKPHAPIGLPFENVSVNVSLGWHTVYLGVGSNIGDTRSFVQFGYDELVACQKIRNVRMSDLIVTKPYGMVEQDDFLNGAIALETIMDPQQLLSFINAIEAHAKRKREIHWGPRTLDLDILFYDDLVCDTENLTIPHADMENRMFVLEPLMQLCPYYRHPVLNRTVRQLYADIKKINKQD